MVVLQFLDWHFGQHLTLPLLCSPSPPKAPAGTLQSHILAKHAEDDQNFGMYTNTEILLDGTEDKNGILKHSTNICLPVLHYQMFI